MISRQELLNLHLLYNPQMKSAYNFVPGIMGLIFILICAMMTSVSIVREKEAGTMEVLLVSPVRPFKIILAKLIPFWPIGLFVITIAMMVAWIAYGLTPLGSVGTIYLATILFILAFSGFGVAVANLSDNIQQTMFVMFFFIIIFILLSGLLTPISSMPEWAQRFTIILPPRYYIEIMRAVYLKGTTLLKPWPHFAALGIFVILFNLLAAATYRKQA